MRNILCACIALFIIALLGVPIYRDYRLRTEIAGTINLITANEATKLDTSWKTQWSPTAPYIVPRKIHVIWLGTKLHAQYLQNLQVLATLCNATQPRVELNLWIDRDSRRLNGNELQQIYGLRVRDIEGELLASIKSTDDYVEQHKINFMRWVVFEYLPPANYAALSDLFRIEILRQEGGLYIDADVDVKTTNAAQFSRNINALFQTMQNNGGFSCRSNGHITNNNVIIASNATPVSMSLQALVRYMVASMNNTNLESYLLQKKSPAQFAIQPLTIAQGPHKLAALAREYFPPSSSPRFYTWSTPKDRAPGLQHMEKLFSCYRNDNAWLDKRQKTATQMYYIQDLANKQVSFYMQNLHNADIATLTSALQKPPRS